MTLEELLPDSSAFSLENGDHSRPATHRVGTRYKTTRARVVVSLLSCQVALKGQSQGRETDIHCWLTWLLPERIGSTALTAKLVFPLSPKLWPHPRSAPLYFFAWTSAVAS
jgi:hypothetical protein